MYPIPEGDRLGGFRNGAEPTYRIVVTTSDDHAPEQHLRDLVAHKRGDLRSLSRVQPAQSGTLHVHLGIRRVDEVLAALEGAGFEIVAVVVVGRSDAHECDATVFRAANARASNL